MWQALAPNLKTLEGALTIRRRILEAFEAAKLEPDPRPRASWLTFAVVGAGPTGVEMAGQIAEIAHDVRGDFRSLDASEARILLIEAGERVLNEFPPSLSKRTMRSLAHLGVDILLEHAVIDVDGSSVTLKDRLGEHHQIPTRTAIWAAGVAASSLAAVLADRAGLEVDRAGRVEVLPAYRSPAIPRCWRSGT
jgi:NADH:ubiquinone reductase (H+-translocating)